MIELTGNYFLKMNFGQLDVQLSPENIKEFTIIQDMNRYLPELRVQFIDPDGILTHTIPSDKNMSHASVQFGYGVGDDTENMNGFDFLIARRSPVGVFGTGTIYDIRGLLDMPGLFAPEYCRAHRGSVKDSVRTIALSELGCSSVEISSSLDYRKTILQPHTRNIDLFTSLKRDLEGIGGQGAYQIFVKQYRGESVFVCRTFEELVREAVKYKFVVNDEPVNDYYPIVDYSILDNYKLFGLFGAKQTCYGYFDYNTSTFVRSTVDTSDFLSLSDYFLIDKDDSTDSVLLQDTGRTSDYTSSFVGHAKSNFYGRLSSLVKMWTLTWGLPNVCPGDVVKVLFAQGRESGNLQSYQFSGYWLVERVIHTFTNTHRTRLLLTRNGLDTDRATTLLPAWRKK